VVNANLAFTAAVGQPLEEIRNRPLREIRVSLREDSFPATRWVELDTIGHWRGEIRERAPNGELRADMVTFSAIYNDEGTITNYVGVFSDIAHIIQQQQALERLANYDLLTGLPNRLLLMDRLGQEIAKTRRNGKYLAVCYLDLNGFKAVNDCHGHATGDRLLEEVALRLKKNIRADDSVARLGGDEFVLLLSDLDEAEDCRPFLERLLREIAAPMSIAGQSIEVRACIGVSFVARGEGSPAAVLHEADQAMYQAKAMGASTVHFSRSCP
jgi:diguanylate cyclase (GGDEF)-like protein